MHTYILDDANKPVPEPNTIKWGIWFETANRSHRVAKDHIGKLLVSTVFLGLDHGHGSSPPVLWETMVFTDDTCRNDLHQERYTSYEDAVAGHRRACQRFLRQSSILVRALHALRLLWSKLRGERR